MLTSTARTGLMVFICWSAPSQTAEKLLTFEAASVKPASPNLPGGVRVVPRGVVGFARIDMWTGGGGLGAKDPGRIHYPVISLKSLLLNAYDVENLQVVGPDWLDTAWFSIDATMPTGTTKEQFELMLRNLLSDRFKLTTHREMKESRGYSLVVTKNGPKMKESVGVSTQLDHSTPELSPQPLQIGPDGFMMAPRRAGVFQQVMPDRIRLTFQQTTMPELANSLQARLKRPVVDSTALTAKFDFTLTFSTDGIDGPLVAALTPPSGGGPAITPEVDAPPDILGALQTQLGLKLEPKTVPVEMIVIDHAEKTPTED
jgi:uncharacterized protein (TIGR03435 family)